MAEQEQVNEQGVYAVVDKVIQELLPFDQNSRLRVYRTVGTFFGFEDSFSKIPEKGDGRTLASVSREPKFSGPSEPTPKEFILEKQPNTDVERVACLAYYLAHYRDAHRFKTIDISKLNTEAAQIKLSNASNAINNGVRDGYLAPAERGMNQLSAHGEKYVEALPDREAVKNLKPRAKSRRSRRQVGAQSLYDPEQVNPNG